MSQTKRISRNTRSLRMKRADTQGVTPGPTPPAPSAEPRMELVKRARAMVDTRGFRIDDALKAAVRRMIEVEIDTRQ